MTTYIKIPVVVQNKEAIIYEYQRKLNENIISNQTPEQLYEDGDLWFTGDDTQTINIYVKSDEIIGFRSAVVDSNYCIFETKRDMWVCPMCVEDLMYILTGNLGVEIIFP